MMTPVSLLANMMVTRQVVGRTAARTSSTSARPLRGDTSTKVVSARLSFTSCSSGRRMESCSTLDVTTCGTARPCPWLSRKYLRAVWMTMLLASVPPEVKMMSWGRPPTSLARLSRALSMSSLAFLPAGWELLGLPQARRAASSTACATSGASGVVALWSRYTLPPAEPATSPGCSISAPIAALTLSCRSLLPRARFRARRRRAERKGRLPRAAHFRRRSGEARAAREDLPGKGGRERPRRCPSPRWRRQPRRVLHALSCAGSGDPPPRWRLCRNSETNAVMESLDTEVKARKTLGTVEYVESSGFTQGILPTKKDVVQNMLYLLQPKRAGQAQRSKEDAAQLLAEHLQEHWLVCNLHTIGTQSIKKLILKMYEEFTRLYQTRKQRQNQAYTERADKFNESSEKLFDIFCTDTHMRNKLEECSGIKMTGIELKFLEDQRSERKMYYEDFTDKQELKMMERRQKIQCLEHFRKLAREEKEGNKAKGTAYKTEEQLDEGTSVDEVYPVEEENGGAPAFSLRGRRKRRCTAWAAGAATPASDAMPLECQHIRMSIRRVRPGFYETVEKVENC